VAQAGNTTKDHQQYAAREEKETNAEEEDRKNYQETVFCICARQTGKNVSNGVALSMFIEGYKCMKK
jgi:hypothetical protein